MSGPTVLLYHSSILLCLEWWRMSPGDCPHQTLICSTPCNNIWFKSACGLAVPLIKDNNFGKYLTYCAYVCERCEIWVHG